MSYGDQISMGHQRVTGGIGLGVKGTRGQQTVPVEIYYTHRPFNVYFLPIPGRGQPSPPPQMPCSGIASS
jgi:hypothetical protein